MKKINDQFSVGILGFGNMGQAIFSLLKKQSVFARNAKFYVCSLGINELKGAICIKEKEKLLEKCDFVFLCVKPQEFYQMEFPKCFSKRNPILISIMAGVRIENIEGITGCRKIVRAMPNLPLQIGRGVTGWYANKKLFEKDELKFIDNIFSYFGKSFFVSSEEKIDAITAISGSGPAYVFLFLDAIVKSAVKLGFSQNQAEEMVAETVIGSTEYFLKIKPGTKLEELILKVKSKKGTTEAALNELDVNNFYKKWESAIRKARARSKEISSYEIK
jgi:pyrroline-5-carboxylate reductase